MLELARAAARFVLPTDCLACRIRRVDRFLEGGVCGPAGRRCRRARVALRALRRDAPGRDRAADAICGRCLLDPPEFESLRAAAPYRGSAREILLAFKFRGADYLAPRLAGCMAERLPPPPADEIVCVPATSRARRARGYHPAEALAAALAARLGIPSLGAASSSAARPRSRAACARRGGPSTFAAPFGSTAGRPRACFSSTMSRPRGRPRGSAPGRLIAAGARAVTVWCFARASRADLPGPPEPDAAMKALNAAIVRTLPFVPKSIVRRIASRYVAGETLEEALASSRR